MADALGWTPAGTFDAILLDAPCSATGTIRRHPDLPCLCAAAAIRRRWWRCRRALARARVGLARAGGRLVYAVCSLLPSEGEAQVARFAGRDAGGAAVVPPDAAALGLDPGWVDAAGGFGSGRTIGRSAAGWTASTRPALLRDSMSQARISCAAQ